MSLSHHLFTQAQRTIPGGVNSPVRAFKGVGGEPIFIERAEGAYLTDVDGKRYIDYIGSWGPMIVGHNHPEVMAAVSRAVSHGLSFGAPTALEVQMAETITDLIPSIEKVRMVNSGTEACMSAIRVARGFTGRDKIVKFVGCYHGHCDALLVSAGSGALTLGIPGSPGVPARTAQDTLVIQYNDEQALVDLMKQYGDEIAAIIVEPIAGNMSLVLPNEGYLELMRQLCDQYGSLLIFDEVMTGFRVALGGAQSLYNIKPDLTVLGKIIGGGMPVGAFGGRDDVMSMIAPLGPVYQAGTLSGNPVAMAAGLATLSLIQQPNFYERISELTQELALGLQCRAEAYDLDVFVHYVGGMFGLFFTEQTSIIDLNSVSRCSTVRYNQFFHGMLQQGIYFAPSAFEAGFVSSAHLDDEIAMTLNAAENVFSAMSVSIPD